ncbi:MAG: efflux RND transporter permease subunit [Planctomycetota bacterium]
MNDNEKLSFIERAISPVIRFFLEKKLVVILLVLLLLIWGVINAPFDWNTGWLPRDPVPVDAIPDIGENQQIVFTKWMGRSPQDIEDQITYPLSTSLLGIPGVKTIRCYSMFGFSSIYIIFKEDIDFYWSRSRVLEKLNSLPSGTLPEGSQPVLGPDATALGQIFWYTLEGRDENGNPTGGWDLDELRSIQDWYVRYALQSVDGVSEVASIGGFVKEYQIDVNPDAMRAYNVKLDEVVAAIKMSNADVGARTIDVNDVEYVIRGIGFIKNLADIEDAVIKVNDNVPIYVKNVAKVSFGPALRRGALDKEGAEVVGGVVVVRYGENPLTVINSVKDKIKEITPGLASKTLPDGTVSKVKIVPFYDRTGLIYETLGTLNTALTHEILITIIVILVMLIHLRSSGLISGLLPLAILMSFIAMKQFGVDANIVALSGIAIAIGTMVDMGIIICENILKHLDKASPDENRLEVVFRATREVGGAVVTAIATTVISFLPVFTMEAAEGKLFKPLAYTKTFALIASAIVSLVMIPPFAHILFTGRISGKMLRYGFYGALILLGIVLMFFFPWWLGLLVSFVGIYHLGIKHVPDKYAAWMPWITTGVLVIFVTVLLSDDWLPLGPEKGFARNLIFVGMLIAILLGFFRLFQYIYRPVLRWFLDHKLVFISMPLLLVFIGAFIWLGFGTLFGWLPDSVRSWKPVSYVAHKFPGLGKEFMPPLDEGSFLYMPTTMPHVSIGEALDILQKQDIAISNIPEIDSVVGKIGRAETPLDPAPVSMVETVINYKPEYLTDRNGKRVRFSFKAGEEDIVRDENGASLLAPDGLPYKVKGKYVRDNDGMLIPDTAGKPFRLWRPAVNPGMNPGRIPWPGIRNPDDIWDEIVREAQIPGSTGAPKLQPIAARIVMLQSGMRAPMGIKVKGPDLETIEEFGLKLEKILKEVPSIDSSTVIADRIVGKPYLEIKPDRKAIARYGIKLKKVQDVLEVALGGKRITTTVEGRERYPVRVRYMRELRDTIENLDKILVPAPGDVQVPLSQLSTVEYVRGPQVIKSEDTALIGYVVFDKLPKYAEVDVVRQAEEYLQQKEKSGELKRPDGVSYRFAGSYENQVRSENKLKVVLPLALIIIFFILYFQFNSVSTSLLVFSGIVVAWSGGFIMLWCYGQPWFMDFSLFGTNMRDLFQVHTINLSVAVWVGFLALFGIASDDGVVMATYLNQKFGENRPQTIQDIRSTTIEAGLKRVRPALMTTATTILALIPILTSTGRGADIMVPMAIPSIGGMLIAVITLFVVPVLYCWLKELRSGQ